MEVFMKIGGFILVLMVIGTGFIYFRDMAISAPCSCFRFFILSK